MRTVYVNPRVYTTPKTAIGRTEHNSTLVARDPEAYANTSNDQKHIVVNKSRRREISKISRTFPNHLSSRIHLLNLPTSEHNSKPPASYLHLLIRQTRFSPKSHLPQISQTSTKKSPSFSLATYLLNAHTSNAQVWASESMHTPLHLHSTALILAAIRTAGKNGTDEIKGLNM